MQVEVHVDARPEDQAMSRSAKVEHPKLIPFFYMLPRIDLNFIRRHFCHADKHYGHQTDVRVVSLNENQRSRGFEVQRYENVR